MVKRPSLDAEGLDDLWDDVARRLETRGADNRGRVSLPALGADARLALGALLGRVPGKTVDLGALEGALVALGVGTDLASSMAELGHPVSDAPARRRADRAAAREAREAARSEAATWPEPWATSWIDDVIRAGTLRDLGDAGARRLVQSVRTVLDALDGLGAPDGNRFGPVSRIDLAARLFGSAHALDTGTRLEAATARALARRVGPAPVGDLWEQAGAHLDLTSGPVLVWNLPVVAGCPLGRLTGEATALGVPLHLTQFALRQSPAITTAGTSILVVENPRIVEAAAQAGTRRPVVSAGGNPSGAVRLLLRQLLDSGADLRYHGDFDTPGLAMCARMLDAGLIPWRMDTTHYLEAVDAAEAAGVALPLDPSPPGSTPWDPSLQQTFGHLRRIVHEERLREELLAS